MSRSPLIWIIATFIACVPFTSWSASTPQSKQIPMLVHFSGGEQWVVGSVLIFEKDRSFELDAPSVGFKARGAEVSDFLRPKGALSELQSGKAVRIQPGATKMWSTRKIREQKRIQLNAICEEAKKCVSSLQVSELTSIELRPLPSALSRFYAQAALRWTPFRFEETTLRFDYYTEADGATEGYARPHRGLTLSEFSKMLYGLSAGFHFQPRSFSDEAIGLRKLFEQFVQVPSDVLTYVEMIEKSAVCETLKTRELQEPCYKKIFPNMKTPPNLYHSAREEAEEHLVELFINWDADHPTEWDAGHTPEGSCVLGPHPKLPAQWYPALKSEIDKRLKTRSGWIRADQARREQAHRQRLADLKKRILAKEKWDGREFRYAIRGASPDLNHEIERPLAGILPQVKLCLTNEDSEWPGKLIPEGWVDSPMIDALIEKDVVALGDLLRITREQAKPILQKKFAPVSSDTTGRLADLESKLSSAPGWVRRELDSALSKPE